MRTIQVVNPNSEGADIGTLDWEFPEFLEQKLAVMTPEERRRIEVLTRGILEITLRIILRLAATPPEFQILRDRLDQMLGQLPIELLERNERH